MQKVDEHNIAAARRALMTMLIAVTASVALLCVVVAAAPKCDLGTPNCAAFSPSAVFHSGGIEQKKATIVAGWKCLKGYATHHPWWSTTIIISSYVPLKMLCIPGGFGMIIAVTTGALFPLFHAHCVIALSELSGSILAWHFYNTCGAPLAVRWFPTMMSKLASMKQRYQQDFFAFALFARTTPLVPNWFVNFAAPIVGIPFVDFAVATLIAVQPAALLSVSVGRTLDDLGEEDLDLWWAGVRNVGCLFLLQGLSLLPKAWNYVMGNPSKRPSSVRVGLSGAHNVARAVAGCAGAPVTHA